MTYRKKPRRPEPLAFVLVLLVLSAQGAAAETAEEKGLTIAREADRRDLGFADSRGEIEMILRNRQGQESRRALRMHTLEVQDEQDGDKTLVVFDRPRDVTGTALLTYTHVLEPDDQWLYLPALKRVKRISSKNKSGPFMGSEFAYEDITSQEVANYSYRYLRDEACGSLTCFVVERVPLYKHSGYTRQITWIDQQEYRVRKLEFYDRKNELLKTLSLKDYRRYLDKFWRAHDLFMQNHQTGKTTRMIWSKYEFRSGLSEKDFTASRLKRAR